jgi:hypothetical protein
MTEGLPGSESLSISERTPPLVRMPISGNKPELPRLEIDPPAAPPLQLTGLIFMAPFIVQQHISQRTLGDLPWLKIGLLLDHRDGVLQRANTGDRDPHRVACVEREWTWRDNTRAGQQYCAVREFLRTEKVVDKLVEGPFDLADFSLAGKHSFPFSQNLKLNAPLEVLAFDVAGTHIVSNRETDDFS